MDVGTASNKHTQLNQYLTYCNHKWHHEKKIIFQSRCVPECEHLSPMVHAVFNNESKVCQHCNIKMVVDVPLVGPESSHYNNDTQAFKKEGSTEVQDMDLTEHMLHTKT